LRGVAVDLRKGSKSFGQWVGQILSAENKKQRWVLEGFAHGFVVLSETAEFASHISAKVHPCIYNAGAMA